MLNGRLHMAAFCYRGRKVRVISFRRANDKEIRLYGKKT
ncbi:MAG: BrnT family toxin [Alphaproteobacteria bacterium]|nr:BrnT family toxin [Alphaproteobacteria bacterium]MDE2493570.1 BrnT family toxin [Alphaproteobacteria bacterium]